MRSKDCFCQTFYALGFIKVLFADEAFVGMNLHQAVLIHEVHGAAIFLAGLIEHGDGLVHVDPDAGNTEQAAAFVFNPAVMKMVSWCPLA